MASLAQLVKDLREEMGWNQQKLADLMGMARTSLTERERGNVRIKPPERKKFAEVFGLTLEEFDARWRANRIEQTVGGNGIPVINRAPAGEIIDYEEYGVDSGQGFEYIDFGQLPTDLHLFAVIVTGDSMEPTLQSDDTVVFRPLDRERDNGTFDEGQIYFVRFAANHSQPGCTIARVWIQDNGDLRLTKDNPRFQPRLVPRDEVDQLGIALERRTKLV